MVTEGQTDRRQLCNASIQYTKWSTKQKESVEVSCDDDDDDDADENINQLYRVIDNLVITKLDI